MSLICFSILKWPDHLVVKDYYKVNFFGPAFVLERNHKLTVIYFPNTSISQRRHTKFQIIFEHERTIIRYSTVLNDPKIKCNSYAKFWDRTEATIAVEHAITSSMIQGWQHYCIKLSHIQHPDQYMSVKTWLNNLHLVDKDKPGQPFSKATSGNGALYMTGSWF